MAPNAQFGTALALDGTRLAAGAPFNPRGTTTGSAEIYEFRGRTLYDEWLSAWGLTGAHLDPMADADGDGQENLMEMALGSDPGDAGSLGRLWAEAQAGNFVGAFPKSGLAGMEGVLSAEVSTDLIASTPASPPSSRKTAPHFSGSNCPSPAPPGSSASGSICREKAGRSQSRVAWQRLDAEPPKFQDGGGVSVVPRDG